jgi:biotin transport system substrate-specific component
MSAGALAWVGRELRREVVVGRRAVAAIGIAAAVVCLTLAAEARVYLPGNPVPVTLQTFFVLVAGAALGPRRGALALSAYLTLGMAGLPLFTSPWLGPTTGYLAGFVAAGLAVALLAPAAARPGTARLAGAMLLGTGLIYLFGAAWFIGLGTPLPLAIKMGVLDFLPGDAVKLAAAVGFCRCYRERFRTLFP